jgi:hypothetical protein
VGNGNGGAASNVANGWGNYFGLGLNKDGGTSLNGSDYTKPVDDGSMSLFRVATVAKGNIDVDSGATVSAGNLKGIGLLTYGRNGSAGDSLVALGAATTGDVEKIEIAATTAGIAGLSLVDASGKLVAGKLNVAAGELIELHSGGAGELEITQGSDLAGNSSASVVLADGTLRLSNTSGSALGDAGLTMDAGALRGNGSTAGAVTVGAGAVVAPGNSVGTLGFGSLTLNADSICEVEITGASSNDKLNVAGALVANGKMKITLSGYAPVAGNSFDIADGTITGAPTFDFTSAVLTAGLLWDTTQFATDGTIRVISADPYIAWAAGFGLTEGKLGDDDKDGSANILEFATNSNPVNGGSGARAFGQAVTISGDTILTLTAAVRTGAIFGAAVAPDAANQQATKDQIIYTVEASNDLSVWNAVVVTQLNPADSATVQGALTLPTLDAGWEWLSFRTDDTLVTDPRDFVRLRVSVQP